VLVILAELQLDDAGLRDGAAGQRGRRLATIPARLDQRLEAQTLEPQIGRASCRERV